jgi:2'-5' RNA ligase
METIRAFMAVTLPAAAKQELGLAADVLAGRVAPGAARWVKPERVHITLRFLGDTAVAKLPAITQIMDEAAGRRTPFNLHLHGTGCFPNGKRPRVVWVGLGGDLAELAALKQDLDAGLVPLGWEMEKRPFRPHLTVGRVKDAKKARGVSWEVAVREEVVPVTAVHLIESRLTRQGPIYTIRHTTEIAAYSPSEGPAANERRT